MAKVVIDIAMSLDGYVAGPNDGPEHGLGENDGQRIMGWDPSERLKDINRDNTGAMITGRRTYDITNGRNGTHDLGGGIPVFVLTESAPAEVPQGGTSFTFVTDGIPLFKNMDYQISMTQTEVRDYAGVTHITYRLQ